VEEVLLNVSPKAVQMTITLSDAGKRYNRDWIFRHFNYTFVAGKSYAITGANGSGKSTLLQCIGGAIALNEGKLQYTTTSSVKIDKEAVHPHLSIAAPYLEVVEEMTGTEFLQFHQQFKPLLAAVSIKEIIELVGLSSSAHKQIRYYSSGMKQRVKLAQAIFSDVPVLLLDEPCTNLDSSGITLYQQLINDYCSNRLVIVSSNDEAEYGFCGERVSMGEWK
jgi:ABC-type multidrug transport system ATPase subunit